MNGAPLTRTPPRRSWGRGPSPPGWRRLQSRRSTCLLLRALQRRRGRVESSRVPGLRGALSSSPVHRHTVLLCWYWGPAYSGIVRLFEVASIDSVAFLTYLLTYSKAKNNSPSAGPHHIPHRVPHTSAREISGTWRRGPTALGARGRCARARERTHGTAALYVVSSLTCSSHTTVTAPRIGGTRGAS